MDRWTEGRAVRMAAAERDYSGRLPDHDSNGEESAYPYVANYSKALPHDEVGDVDQAAYRALLRAICTGREEDFERIPLGVGRKLTNPQAGLAFDLEGPDAQGPVIPPAPRIDNSQNSAEMGELYWMALARDVRFTDFDADPIVRDAAADLSEFSDFRGPKDGGRVTPGTLFRGLTPGDLAGPYISQFLLRDIPYGTLIVPQRQETVPAGSDHLCDFPEWLEVQNGKRFDPCGRQISADRRYIQTPRDMAHYVHFDALYEAYLNACLILLGMCAPLDAGNPYQFSRNQEGFGTYGGPHILSLVTEVATRALKAVWFQKWSVHRRLRPEEFGGRIHAHLSGMREYPMIDQEILDADVVKAIYDRFGSYLLPQAFPEGSPTHPAYGAGHATVAGACVTILKAWFDESYAIPDPRVPNGAGDRLVPYEGGDRLTVGGELNKVAANVAIGRNMGGVHWRTDYTESVKLGEEVAIGVLRDQKLTTNEEASFTITRFDGRTITV